MKTHSLLLALLIVCSACAAPAGRNAMDGDGAREERDRAGGFEVREEASPAGELAFTVLKDGKSVTAYTVTHTKELHLIVVRSDLEHFQHLHPVRDAAGVWRTSFSVPAGGTYWLYADFSDADGQPRTIRFTKEMPGVGGTEVRPHLGDPVRDPSGRHAAEKTVDGYRIQASNLRYAEGVEFFFTVLGPDGKDAVLDDYLGEKGHVILISPDGDFVRMHPHKEYVGYKPTDSPVFYVEYPKDGFYRMFAQFQVGGTVLTVDFDWNDTEPPVLIEPVDATRDAAASPQAIPSLNLEVPEEQ